MIVLSASKLIDSNGVLDDPIVFIKEGVITNVASKGDVKIPDDAEFINAPDMYLIPGLIDCHVHFTGSNESTPGMLKGSFESRLVNAAVNQTRSLLNNGITSVMDTGGLIGVYVRDSVNQGIVEGPRIMAAGSYLSPTGGHGDYQSLPLEWVKEGRPFGWGMDGRIADGVAECMVATREQLRRKADFVKICTGGGGGSQIDPPWIPEYTFDEIKAVVGIAHDWGRKVMAHCYYPESIKRSVVAGVDIITHGNMADDGSVALMKNHSTMLVPTMSVYERINQMRPESLASEMYDNLFSNIRKFYDAGLTLAVGTDTMGGIFPFGESAFELILYVEKVGLSPLEAIRIGTFNGAKVMGLSDKLGTVEAGKYADLVILDRDPLEDIRCLTDEKCIRSVLVDGVFVKNTL